MSINRDITKKTLSSTKGADCRTESENNPAHGRAYEDDAIDMIHHHTECGREKDRGPASETEQEPDYVRGDGPL